MSGWKPRYTKSHRGQQCVYKWCYCLYFHASSVFFVYLLKELKCTIWLLVIGTSILIVVHDSLTINNSQETYIQAFATKFSRKSLQKRFLITDNTAIDVAMAITEGLTLYV